MAHKLTFPEVDQWRASLAPFFNDGWQLEFVHDYNTAKSRLMGRKKAPDLVFQIDVPHEALVLPALLYPFLEYAWQTVETHIATNHPFPDVLVWVPFSDSFIRPSSWEELAQAIGKEAISHTALENTAFRRQHHITMVYGKVSQAPGSDEFNELDIIHLPDFLGDSVYAFVEYKCRPEGFVLRTQQNIELLMGAVMGSPSMINYYRDRKSKATFEALFPFFPIK